MRTTLEKNPQNPTTRQTLSLSEDQRRQARETRQALEESPVMSLEELRAQTPRIPLESPIPTTCK